MNNKIISLLKKTITNKKSLNLRSSGNSMLPVLFDEDIILVRKVSFRNIKVDDILTILHKRSVITHRVVYKNYKNHTVITKGDNNFKHDGLINQNNILGTVREVKRSNQLIDVHIPYLYQSTVYHKEIEQISTLLKMAGIKFAVLKGLPLHIFYEGSHPQRFYVDCDILIDKKALLKTSSLFKTKGYKTKQNLHLNNYEVQFSKFTQGIKVTFDIHIKAVFLMTQLQNLDFIYPEALLNKFSSELLANTHEINLNGVKFPILKQEYLIIYLTLHIFHHNFIGYNRYLLLLAVLKKERYDLKLFSDVIKRYQLSNYLYPAFLAVNKYYSTANITYAVLKVVSPKGITKEELRKKFYKLDIFSEEPRLIAGLRRFYLIFSLSPLRIRRFLIFSQFRIYVSGVYLIFRLLFSLIRNYPLFRK